MPAVLVTASSVKQDSLFFSSGQPVLILPTHGGMAQAESTWVSGSVQRCFNHPKMVIYPGINEVGVE